MDFKGFIIYFIALAMGEIHTAAQITGIAVNIIYVLYQISRSNNKDKIN
jgi:hypothetical protein